MCIVIDINSLSVVLSPSNKNHFKFAPIRKWIEKGHGFLVYGGTRYKNELEGCYSYLKLVGQMKVGGRAVHICDAAVDNRERHIEAKLRGTNCNDTHIIAILGTAWCSLLCSEDKHSFEFIKKKCLYPSGMRRVRIYTSKENKGLLTVSDKNRLKNVDTRKAW